MKKALKRLSPCYFFFPLRDGPDEIILFFHMRFLSSKQISLIRENPYIYKAHQDQNSSAARLKAQTRPVEIRNKAFFNVLGSISKDISLGNSWLEEENIVRLDGKYTQSSCSYEQVSSMAI